MQDTLKPMLCMRNLAYIAANNVLQNKTIKHTIVVTKPPRTQFDNLCQTIHFYGFSQYQKYLCNIFSLWSYPL